jgi:hypothetical protein
MAEPASDAPDSLEAAVEQAIAICDGNVRAALRAALGANSFLMDEVERLTRAASFGFARGKISPARRASERLERWREIRLVRRGRLNLRPPLGRFWKATSVIERSGVISWSVQRLRYDL